MIAHGNREVVQLLEKWLAIARNGNLNFGALTICELLPYTPDQASVTIDFAGSVEMQTQAVIALDALRNNLVVEIANRLPPKQDCSLGADCVSYNIAGAPVSWDFLPWLIDAEMTRVRERAPSPLKVSFLNGLDGNMDAGSDYRRQMFANVVRPLLRTIGAVESPATTRGRHKKVYTMRDIAAAVRAGEKIPKLQTPCASCLESGAVTITLREAAHWPHRNSDLPAWIRFARHLLSRGEKVVFVRDVAKEREPLEDFITVPNAGNVLLRMAAYESAKCNLFVMNGPTSLAWFGSRPWLSFVSIDPDDPYEPNRPGWWIKAHGIEDGSQFPWSGRNQRLIWKRDSYENLCEAWDALSLN